MVDISFNQLGGLCTLCFLEEVSGAFSNHNLSHWVNVCDSAWMSLLTDIFLLL